MNSVVKCARIIHHIGTVIYCTILKYLDINGSQWAASIAYSAFFSLFPLMVLIVTIASAFINRDEAGKTVISYVESYVPISGDMQKYIFGALTGVVEARGKAGLLAFGVLVWGALQLFSALITVTNRAWGVDGYNWWSLPLRSLALLGIVVGIVLLGIAIPIISNLVTTWIVALQDSWLYNLSNFFIPLAMLFLSLSLFYKLAPRRPTRFAEVWLSALCATVLLRASESLFEIYLTKYAKLNAVYGAFGATMALLLWIYLCGCIFIGGACLCAVNTEQLGGQDQKAPSPSSKSPRL